MQEWGKEKYEYSWYLGVIFFTFFKMLIYVGVGKEKNMNIAGIEVLYYSLQRRYELKIIILKHMFEGFKYIIYWLWHDMFMKCKHSQCLVI